MSSYTESKLTLWGLTTQDEFEELQGLLESPHRGWLADFSEDFSQDAYTCFYENVEDGKLDDRIRKKVEMLGLSYEWSWEESEDLQAGVIVYDAETGRTFEFDTNSETDICLTLTQLDDKSRDWLSEARICQKLRDQAAEIRLTASSSAHEEMEAIQRITAIRTQVQEDE